VIRTKGQKLAALDLTPQEKEPQKPAWAILKVKRKAPGPSNTSANFEEEMTVAERAAELKKKSDDVKGAYAKLYQMGKDVDVAALRAEKTDVAAIRTELQKEIDDQTKTMKDGLARILDTRVTAYAAEADNQNAAATLQVMLTPMTGQNPTNP